MKRQILPLLTLTIFSFYASAQTTGDYRSNANNFNWNTNASWERFNGATWQAPTAAEGYPGETAASIAGTVTIRNGHDVTANVDVTTNDIGNLVLAGDAVLIFNNGIDIQATGNLSMDVTSDIQGGGSNRTLRIGGTFNVPATATNARIGHITLTVVGATTIVGSLNLTSNIVMNIANLSLQGNGRFNLNANNEDVNVTGNLTMDGTSRIVGNDESRTIDVSGTFTVPASATDVRITGVELTINGPTTVAGTLTLADDGGEDCVMTFNVRVTVTGSWTSTAIDPNDHLVFNGEVITSGVFACGCN
jgi:hypothetical protein